MGRANGKNDLESGKKKGGGKIVWFTEKNNRLRKSSFWGGGISQEGVSPPIRSHAGLLVRGTGGQNEKPFWG